jgi:pilus assembly protein Flp/PilA
MKVELRSFILMNTENSVNGQNSSKSAHKEAGATMIEYALLVALIAIIALAGVRFLGQQVSKQFSVVARTLNSNMATGLAGSN